MTLRWHFVIAVSLVLGCDTSRPDGEATPAADSARSDSAVAAVEPTPRISFEAPRRAADIRLRPLWTVGGSSDPGRLIQPLSLAVASFGVLVSEMDGTRVLVFRERDGELVESQGRYGNGPGEFGRIPQLLGSLASPLAFEGPSGRISRLSRGQPPQTSAVSSARRWLTACELTPARVLLQHNGWNEDGYYVSTIGENAALVDSFAYPFPELSGVDPLARQASLQQVDDSSCAILPGYASSFAILSASSLRIGVSIEPVPVPSVVETKRGEGFVRSLADDVRLSFLSAASWQRNVLILFAGASSVRSRVIDVYSADLAYQGSIQLPFRARFVAVKGDNLYVLGEEADEPLLAAFRLLR